MTKYRHQSMQITKMLVYTLDHVINLFLRKPKLHDVKQNEKYLYTSQNKFLIFTLM